MVIPGCAVWRGGVLCSWVALDKQTVAVLRARRRQDTERDQAGNHLNWVQAMERVTGIEPA
jgi:hypothetical protein